MKIMPTHSLGFLNLWILMFLFALPILVTVITKPQIFSATSEQFRNKKNSSEFRFFIAAKFFMLFYFIYSFFVPFSSNSSLFIAGAVVYLFGFSFYIAAWVIISKTGPNKLFTTGPFRFSRHPVYVSSFVMFLGAGIISSSLLFLIISILVGITHLRNGKSEERNCLNAFGDDYGTYMKKTHRWIGLPKKDDNFHE